MRVGYDREHDRLLGADEVRTFHGRSTKSLLMPATRAMPLKDALQALGNAYKGPGQDGMPFPQVMALIDPGLALPASLGLPDQYNELCQMVTIIPEGPVLTRRLPQSDDEGRCFAETLFSVLRSGHDAGLAFGTGRTVTSIKTENVTLAGAFVDLYHLASEPGRSREAAATGMANDMTHALALVWMACGRTPGQWRSSLHAAMAAYRLAIVPDRLKQVAGTTYGSLSVAGPAQAGSIVAVLASDILAGSLARR